MAKRRRNAAKEKFWRRAVEDWRRSGFSVRAYCARAGLSEPSFYVWRRELQRRDRSAASNQASAFVPVEVTAEPSAAIEIVLPQGAVVRVRPGFDRQTLQDVMALVAGGASSGGASC